MPETVVGALIGAGGTLLAAFIGIAAIIVQMGRQGKLNRVSIEESERRRLRSKMYEEVEIASAELAAAVASLASKLVFASQEINVAAQSHNEGRQYPLPRSRIMEIDRCRHEFESALINLIGLIERRQFISPDILVFRTALHSSRHEFQSKYDRQYFRAAMIALPIDLPDASGAHPYGPLSPDLAQSLDKLTMELVDELHTMASYSGDFSIEMQNYLVADLFGTSIEHRRPSNPKFRVVTLKDAAELEDFFLMETAWGKWVREQEAAIE